MTKPISMQDFLKGLTDELVKSWGYTDVAMYRMGCELGTLAGKWRRTKEDSVIAEYHALFYKLVELGWNPNLLDVESSLPRSIMPTWSER